MSEIHAVSRERHGTKTWQRSSDYFFARNDAIAALTAQELPRAMMATAIAFAPDSGGFVPVALQGLISGKNYFVDSNGKWRTSYIPAMYRTYPFRLAQNANHEKILCIDESSNLIGENEQGEMFFTAEGLPADILKEVFQSLISYQTDQETTRKVCDLLHKFELIQPWDIKIKNANQDITNIDGLFKIDETKLNLLPGDALAELRNVGGLVVAYSQLFSMQLLPYLTKLAQSLASDRSVNEKQPVELGFTISEDSGTLSFDNL